MWCKNSKENFTPHNQRILSNKSDYLAQIVTVMEQYKLAMKLYALTEMYYLFSWIVCLWKDDI